MTINLTVDPSLPKAVYLQLMDQIIHLIAVGELRNGDQLPSIRKLSVALRINPNTVVKVYRQLEELGFVSSHHGLGFFVSPRNIAFAKRELRKQALQKISSAVEDAIALGASGEDVLEMVREITGAERSNVAAGD